MHILVLHLAVKEDIQVVSHLDRVDIQVPDHLHLADIQVHPLQTKGIQEQVHHLLIKDIQVEDPRQQVVMVELHLQVNSMVELHLLVNSMEEDILQDSPVLILRFSPGSMQWTRTGVDRLTTRSSRGLWSMATGATSARRPAG